MDFKQLTALSAPAAMKPPVSVDEAEEHAVRAPVVERDLILLVRAMQKAPGNAVFFVVVARLAVHHATPQPRNTNSNHARAGA